MLASVTALSFAPAMYRNRSEWRPLFPHPNVELETADVLDGYADRFNAAFDALAGRITEVAPDRVVVLTADDGRLFTPVQVPQFCTFLGSSIWGDAAVDGGNPDVVELTCDETLAAFVHQELIAAEFDMNYMREFRALGKPEWGAPASLVEPIRRLGLGDTPVLPLFVNAHVDPASSGQRCYDFGATLADVLGARDERVAIIASGGLSRHHDGPRAGWVDEPLDRWLLDRIRRGDGWDLGSLYDLESDTLSGGAAEMRLWAIAAGAAEAEGARATVLDYVPWYTGAAGVAFAHWSA